jgi:hypothetical protein
MRHDNKGTADLIVHPSIRLEIARDRLRDRQADATRHRIAK